MLSTRQPRHRHALGIPVVGIVLALVLALGGCSDEGGEPSTGPTPSAEQTSTATAEPKPPPLRTTTKVGEVVGQLSKERRRKAADAVSRVVDRWWRAAYLGDDFPRRRISRRAFPAFTDGAFAQARGDRALMTNAALDPKFHEVVATRRRVTVDLLAVGGRARTATARIGLNFRATGKRAAVVAVRGRLLLTREKAGWRVFGYDVTRGAVPKGDAGKASKHRSKKQDHSKKKDRTDKKDRGRERRSGKGRR